MSLLSLKIALRKKALNSERVFRSILNNKEKPTAPKKAVEKVRNLGFDKDWFNGRFIYSIYADIWPCYCFYNSTNAYFLIVINKNYFIFRVDSERFVKKRLFFDKDRIKWDLMRRCLKDVSDFSAAQMLETDYALTMLDSQTFARSFPNGLFEGILKKIDSLDEHHDSSLVSIFEAKFEIDDVQFAQIEKILQKMKPDDPLYEDIVAKKRKAAQIYDVKEQKYYDVIESLKKKFDKDDKPNFEKEQLRILSS